MYSNENEQGYAMYAKTSCEQQAHFENSRKINFESLIGWLSWINDFADFASLFTRPYCKQNPRIFSCLQPRRPINHFQIYFSPIKLRGVCPVFDFFREGNLPENGGNTEITTYYVGFSKKLTCRELRFINKFIWVVFCLEAVEEKTIGAYQTGTHDSCCWLTLTMT